MYKGVENDNNIRISKIAYRLCTLDRMYRDTFLKFDSWCLVQTGSCPVPDVESVVYHDTLSRLQYAVAVDAFSDNESDDRRKWRLDVKVRIMRLEEE